MASTAPSRGLKYWTRVFLICMIAAMGGCLFGYDLGGLPHNSLLSNWVCSERPMSSWVSPPATQRMPPEVHPVSLASLS